KGPVGTTAAAMVMMLVMLPAFLLGVYEKHGQPLETVLSHIVRVSFLRPKRRPYRTRNFYSLLLKQDHYDEEVARIVREKSAFKTAEKRAGRSENRRAGG
ncbi:MAG: PrgI family protein, partial [Clostridia bacterium]|nr:PrgI family protein [Clostridia bacterium]